MEKQVLTEVEVAKITELREKFSQFNIMAGSNAVAIMNLEVEREKIKEAIQSLNQQEQVLAKELEEKYGKGTISLETNEFIPAP